MAKGLDCGTAYYVAAHENNKIKKQNNSFLTLEGDPSIYKRQLGRMNIPYVTLNGRVHIVGKHAFDYAQIFGSKELRRPMKAGLLNPKEKDALPILKTIVAELLGPPQKEGETCVYCVPAEAIDNESLVDYHEDVLSQIIESLGYKPQALREAVALAYHGLIDDNLTGIALSFGAGMCNAAILFAGLPAVNFSVARGGDWIDDHVSMDTATPKARVQFLKESGELNLSPDRVTFTSDGPKVESFTTDNSVQQALKSYYAVLINYILSNIANKFKNSKNVPNFQKPVTVVLGGGTAMVPGFVDLFKEQLEKINFPIEIGEVKLTSNPHEAVALGCFNEATLIEEEVT